MNICIPIASALFSLALNLNPAQIRLARYLAADLHIPNAIAMRPHPDHAPVAAAIIHSDDELDRVGRLPPLVRDQDVAASLSHWEYEDLQLGIWPALSVLDSS